MSALGFGVVVTPGQDGRAWADQARWLEDQGWTSLLVPDTLRTPSPFPVLAAAAAVTTRIRLRTWVLAAPLRTAGAVVREASALQLLSDGRLELGIGPGRPDVEAEAARVGARWGTPGERIGQVEEVVTAVREQVRPVPELVVAAAGPRMLAAAGRIADRIAIATPPQATEQDLTTTVRLARDAVLRGNSSQASAGREVGLTQQLFGICDLLPEWLVQVAGLDAATLAAAGAVGLMRGGPEEMATTLLERQDRLGIDEVVVPGELADVFAPVLERLQAARE
jgi:alkanesulfonate monooxygenase SsuD/methylene tetrahydromethanopterin reductase-like flavin-dependent oxidoreductase (luciferase family)